MNFDGKSCVHICRPIESISSSIGLRLVYQAEPIPQHAIHIILKLLMQNGKNWILKLTLQSFFRFVSVCMLPIVQCAHGNNNGLAIKMDGVCASVALERSKLEGIK